MTKLVSWIFRKIFYLKRPRSVEVSISTKTRVNYRPICLSPSTTLKIQEGSIVRAALHCEKEGSSISIGSSSFLGGGTTLIASHAISVGDNVLISSGCYLIDSDGHSLDADIRRKDIPNRWKDFKDWTVVQSAPIVIENDAWIGPRSMILKGVTVGAGAIVGAGSVVTRSVAPYTMVAGCPAKKIRDLPR